MLTLIWFSTYGLLHFSCRAHNCCARVCEWNFKFQISRQFVVLKQRCCILRDITDVWTQHLFSLAYNWICVRRTLARLTSPAHETAGVALLDYCVESWEETFRCTLVRPVDLSRLSSKQSFPCCSAGERVYENNIQSVMKKLFSLSLSDSHCQHSYRLSSTIN